MKIGYLDGARLRRALLAACEHARGSRAELNRINGPAASGGGADQSELDRAKLGLKSSLVLSGESTGARAAALASDMHRLGRPRSALARGRRNDDGLVGRVRAVVEIAAAREQQQAGANKNARGCAGVSSGLAAAGG